MDVRKLQTMLEKERAELLSYADSSASTQDVKALAISTTNFLGNLIQYIDLELEKDAQAQKDQEQFYAQREKEEERWVPGALGEPRGGPVIGRTLESDAAFKVNLYVDELNLPTELNVGVKGVHLSYKVSLSALRETMPKLGEYFEQTLSFLWQLQGEKSPVSKTTAYQVLIEDVSPHPVGEEKLERLVSYPQVDSRRRTHMQVGELATLYGQACPGLYEVRRVE